MKRPPLAAGLVWPVLLLVLFSTGVAGKEVAGQKDGLTDPPGESRSFRFDYAGAIDGLPEGAEVRVWLPVPQSGRHQQIEALKPELPAEAELTLEPTYGNKILYFETRGPASGTLRFKTSYLVRRQEVRGLSGEPGKGELTEEQRKLFLSANEKVPLRGKQLELLGAADFSPDSLIATRALYERVDDHVRYDKSQPGYGKGDVLWVCDSRSGNCTDFHSLFISLARAARVPARFEIGFSLPSERGEGSIGGYHCWAFFYSDQKGWVPVDISEADKRPEMKEYYFGNLDENRVSFSVGRDIRLVPGQQGEPLNFFVYPHVEVDGKPWPQEKIKHSFAYRDMGLDR